MHEVGKLQASDMAALMCYVDGILAADVLSVDADTEPAA